MILIQVARNRSMSGLRCFTLMISSKLFINKRTIVSYSMLINGLIISENILQFVGQSPRKK